MTDSIGVVLRLSAFLRKEGACWESSCPTLDVYSQGDSKEEAKANLQEAVELWMESCLERNTLSDALRELGWHRVPLDWPTPPDTDSIHVLAAEDAEVGRVLGDPFSVEVTVPAYQAAIFTGEVSAPPC